MDSLLVLLRRFILILTPFLLCWSDCFPGGPASWPGIAIKIEISETGIHEIPYSKLMEMGFPDPGKISVFGNGGCQYPVNFIDEAGNDLFSESFSEINVWHNNGKLFFYATGPDEIELSADGKYKRVNKNIYSDKGYYFLIESSGSPASMERKLPDNDTFTEIEEAVSFIYHEEDLRQNTSGTGQLFWGESLLDGEPIKRWPVEFPGLKAGKPVDVKCAVYVDDRAKGTLSFGLEGSETENVIKLSNRLYPDFRVTEPSEISVLPPPGYTGHFFVNLESSGGSYANIDYWLLNYRREMPRLIDAQGFRLPQERFGVNGLAAGATGHFYLSGNASGAVVVDVTDRRKPVIVSGGNEVMIDGNGRPHDLIVFDPNHEQPGITGYTVTDTRESENKISSGADFAIITIPSLKKHAERLAELHSRNDGIKTLVITAEEVYDLFSGGLPDPMAYRKFVRELSGFSEGRLKNLLLMGPLYGDFRVKDGNQFDRLIAFQNPRLSKEEETTNINDFYGMTDDYIDPMALEKGRMEVAVGVLPFYDVSDASTYLSKVEAYMSNDHIHHIVNETFGIGGTGDNHTHDIQALELSETLNQLTDYNIVDSSVIIDALGYEAARKRFIGSLERGKVIGFYIGHGALTMLGKDKNFFTSGDALSLQNKDLPFMFFAGCTLSEFDKGKRGLGEILVIGSGNGLIGSVLATRPVWSSQNFEFAKRFFTRLYCVEDITSERLDSAPTIGEIYARAKQAGENVNDFAFQLLCDPALKLPLAHLKMNFAETTLKELKPGEKFRLKGNVCDKAGKILSDFNGKAVVKIMEPEMSRELAGNITGEAYNGSGKPLIKYNDRLLESVPTEVVNGVMDVEIALPEEAGQYAGENLTFFVSSYDYTLKQGAAGRLSVVISDSGSISEVDKDQTPPLVSDFYFDKVVSELSFTVSDNQPLRLSRSNFELKIDDTEYSADELTINYNDNGRIQICVLRPGPLEEGLHEISVKVTDTSGNESITLRTVRVYSPEASVTLSTDRPVLDDEILFMLEASGEAVDGVVVITDSHGIVKARLKIENGQKVWDGMGSDGKRLSRGLYKATAVTTGGWSETLPLAVI